MTHPPLSTALHLVLSANLDQTARHGLLAAMRPRLNAAPASAPDATGDVTPITRSAQRATTHRSFDQGQETQSNVLTMPRVIPLPRSSEASVNERDLDPDLDPDAA